MKRKKIVVIGFAGTQLDSGKTPDRWNKWRPSVSITQQDDIMVDRFDMLFNGPYEGLVERLREDIGETSPATKVSFHKLAIDDPWDFENVYSELASFAKNYPFDLDKEEYWIHITTGSHVVQICLFLLTKATYFPGLLLQTSPPKRAGDVGSYQLIDLDLSRYNKIGQLFATEREAATDVLKHGIQTRNPAYNEVISEIERVAARSREPMLFLGPTGAGKSFLAKKVFDLKKSRHKLRGKFVDVNCATLHRDSAASALFGHVRGSFTGSTSDRPGLLMAANKGALFLDEIGTLGLDEQAMLLKAIEDKKFYPVGSDNEVTSDFILIAGTNMDLHHEVAAGRFRRDLFARINTWTYQLPSLRERPEDIEPNVDFQLQRYWIESSEMVRFNKEARMLYLDFAVSPDALWVNNFRDLSSSISRMATLASSGRITVQIVKEEITKLQWLWHHEKADVGLSQTSGEDLLPGEQETTCDPFDLVQLRLAVKVCRQSKTLSEAGRKLFAVSRLGKTKQNDADRLKKYLAKFGLSWESLTADV